MRHRVAGRKLGRKTAHRRAMWRNMAISLFTHGQITTTLPKAKSLKPFVEKLISKAKQGDLHARRQVTRMLGRDHIMVANDQDDQVKRNAYGELVGGPKVVKKLFEEIAPRYADRAGGYTRIIKLSKHRLGDGADLCVIQLVGEEESGPQLSGQYSRRREVANKRMERAAALRRGDKVDKTAAAPAVADEQETAEPSSAVQADVVDQEQPENESPATEAAPPGDDSKAAS